MLEHTTFPFLGFSEIFDSDLSVLPMKGSDLQQCPVHPLFQWTEFFPHSNFQVFVKALQAIIQINYRVNHIITNFKTNKKKKVFENLTKKTRVQNCALNGFE